jgi:hypothetical protein
MTKHRRLGVSAVAILGVVAGCGAGSPPGSPPPISPEANGGRNPAGQASGGHGPSAGTGGETGSSAGGKLGGAGTGTGGAAAQPSAPDADGAPAAADAGPDGAGVPGTPGLPTAPGLVKIFDGSGWDNWDYDPKAWTIVEGAMHGHITGGQSQAFTKKDYANFRLIVWSRMTKGNDHLGICIWGGRPGAGKYGFERCLLVIPPNGAIWDYLENKDYPKPDYQKGMEVWHRTEILANQKTGKVLVAISGKLIHEFQDTPDRLAKRKPGPVGMQIHKAGEPEVEYKDIEIEVDPPSDKLVTLTP